MIGPNPAAERLHEIAEAGQDIYIDDVFAQQVCSFRIPTAGVMDVWKT